MVRSTTTFGPSLLMLLSAFAVHTLAGCSDGGTPPAVEQAKQVGELALGLSLDSGLSISSVHYEISGNGVLLSGDIPVSGSGMTFTTTIPGLPVGAGYLVKLTATPTNEPAFSCGGLATFAIVAGGTTLVNVVLACDEPEDAGTVVINGRFDVCPSIRSAILAPETQLVGGTIAISAAVRDLDMGPAQLSYSWTASAGSLANAQSSAPTLTCTQAGDLSVSLQVSDGACTKSTTVTAHCTGPVIDAGADGGLDASATSDSGLVDAGSPDSASGDARVPDSGSDAGSSPLVRINEIESKDGVPADWIELYNYGAATLDLSGWILSDSKKAHLYTIPAGTSIAGGGFLVFEQAVLGYGLGDADATRLFKPDGTTLVDGFAWAVPAATTYGRCPDGSGAFRSTTGATKGVANSCGPSVMPLLVINEIETKGFQSGDWIELFNADSITVDVSGWVIKDKNDLSQYVLPAGTMLDPGAYLVIEGTQLNFGLNPIDAVRLFDSTGSLLMDFYSWSANSVNTYGRCPNGTGPFVDTAGATKGTANNCAVVVPAAKIVINEVESKDGMPGDWVELYNAGNAVADVSGWVLKDKNNNDAYQIPANTTVGAGGYFVLNQAQFVFNFGAADSARLYLFANGGQSLVDSYAWATHAATTYGRCPNGTGPFVTTVAPTKGTSNSCP